MTENPNELAPDSTFEFDALKLAKNYRKTLLREFREYLRGDVLEVGSGVGQFTAELKREPSIARLTGLEPGAAFCLTLRRENPELEIVEGTIAQIPPEAEYDTIVTVNVLEHIRDDQNELKRYAGLLKNRKGHVCLFVPARPEIYAPLDRDFGHHRRYVKEELRLKLETAGFSVVRLDYFNLIGYVAWWFNFCLLKQRRFSPGGIRFYDGFIFPAGNWIESHIRRPPIGQSLLAVAIAG